MPSEHERPDDPSESGLTQALAALGLPARVEIRARLAVIHPVDADQHRLGDLALRRRIVAVGRAMGFTHVALAVGEGEA